MKTVWVQPDAASNADHSPGDSPDAIGPVTRREMTAPLSLIISAFAPVTDARRCLTPWLRLDQGPTALVLIDLGRGRNRLGGSCLAQVHGSIASGPPDLDDPAQLRALFDAIQALNADGRLLAYHDRSDGGLIVTLLEMAFAGHCGLDLDLDALPCPRGPLDPLAALFSEEPGVVVQVREADLPAVLAVLADHGLGALSHVVGQPRADDRVLVEHRGRRLLDAGRRALHQAWAETSWRMARLRDHPDCADEEFARIAADEPGLSATLTFDPAVDIVAPLIAIGARPRLAVLREQGVNGQAEMAGAFDRAGFDCVDVHMSDLIAGRLTLDGFHGLAACGGFSYGDVLGAGGGWARGIRFNPRARDAFAAFFARPETFTLGVCNGCQMLSQLADLIPGAEPWPAFVRNRSAQFEARLVLVEVPDSPSVLFTGMAGSRLPVVVAHGEGRAEFRDAAQQAAAAPLVALRYIETGGLETGEQVATRYPANPNGSPDGITGLTSLDGRVTILMPHPERLFRTVQYSWHPDDWGTDGPWLRLFRNARGWLG